MTARLFLLRHGETLANLEYIYQGQSDSPLSKRGKEEAEILSKYLQKEPFAAIYSSNLKRSFDTAKAISKRHKGISVQKVKELAERNYGKFEGLHFEKIRERYPKIYDLWLKYPNKAKIPGAETLKQLQKRGVLAVEKLLKKHKDQTICIVGHGGINRAIIFYYMKISLDNFWRIKQDNCCINIIEFSKRPVISLLNSSCFVGEKRITKDTTY